MSKRILELEHECETLEKKLSDPELLSNAAELAVMSRQFAQCKKKLGLLRELEQIEKNMRDNKKLRRDEYLDPGLSELAVQEYAELESQKMKKEENLARLDRDGGEERESTEEVIVEIRPGTGGEEAALFAKDLLRMYQRFAELEGWKTTMLNDQETDLGGLREAIFLITGKDAYDKLRFESGVHRVQRIPETEKSGRIHTSAATVAVLPKPRGQDVTIAPKDIRIDMYRASGPGGQNVNRRESAVRVTHLPTGITVASQSARTQLQNRDNALSILKARLLEQERTRIASERGETRKTQIGTGERSEKIRTYNFPQDRLTDHRIGKSWYNIERIMAGDLEPIISILAKELSDKVAKGGV